MGNFVHSCGVHAPDSTQDVQNRRRREARVRWGKRERSHERRWVEHETDVSVVRHRCFNTIHKFARQS